MALCGAPGPWGDELLVALEQEGFAVVDHRAAQRDLTCELAVCTVSSDADPTAELLGAARAAGARGVLVVVPRAAAEPIAAAAYAAGADQVLEQPVSPREVVARLRALLRRLPPKQPRRPPAGDPSPIVAVDLATNLATVDGRKVGLTAAEAHVLDLLVARGGGVVTRDELAACVGSRAEAGLDGVVRSVRAKLEDVEGIRRLVVVRGLGFRLLAAP